MAPVESPSDRSEYSSGGSSGIVHNYVFFNTTDASVHTLLPTKDYWITDLLSLPETKDGSEKEEPV